MKYYKIKASLEKIGIFNLQDLYLLDPNFRQETLYDWVKQGRIFKLKRNCYVFSDFKAWGLNLYLISNRMYQPSYVSLELALNHYGIIPESVHAITAISTLKTQKFKNTFGIFQYHSIAKNLFFGYCNISHLERNVQISTPEKTILDYLYLNTHVNSVDDFIELRWNQEILNEKLNWEKLMSYLAIFDSKTLKNRVSVLKEYLKV